MPRTSSPSLHVKSSTFIHAVMAYVSPEATTFDEIIHLKSRCTPSLSHRTTILSLPPELLIRIRSHLQRTLTSSLIAHSSVALKAYEQAAISGLCDDCRFYNEEVFGADVWDWPDFGSRCGCWDIGVDNGKGKARVDSRMSLSPVPAVGVYGLVDESLIKTRLSTGTCLTPFHWLSHHLSLSLTQTLAACPSSYYASECKQSIEALASAVLLDFGCTFEYIPNGKVGCGVGSIPAWTALAIAFRWDDRFDGVHGRICALTDSIHATGVHVRQQETLKLGRLFRELGLDQVCPELRDNRVARIAAGFLSPDRRATSAYTSNRRHRTTRSSPSFRPWHCGIFYPSYILQALVLIVFISLRRSVSLGHGLASVVRQFFTF